MDFWNLDEEDKVDDNDGDYAISEDFGIIPKNTNLKVNLEEAKWDVYGEKADEREGESFISITWAVLAPEEYKNRKIFQKVQVNLADESKRKKHQKMLIAINKNANGKLFDLGREPQDTDLMSSLYNKMMVIKVGVWEMGDNSGNWVMAVSPKDKPLENQSAVKPSIGDDDDDDIPF